VFVFISVALKNIFVLIFIIISLSNKNQIVEGISTFLRIAYNIFFFDKHFFSGPNIYFINCLGGSTSIGNRVHNIQSAYALILQSIIIDSLDEFPNRPLKTQKPSKKLI